MPLWVGVEWGDRMVSKDEESDRERSKLYIGLASPNWRNYNVENAYYIPLRRLTRPCGDSELLKDTTSSIDPKTLTV
jgi:hypothetical protein